MTITDLIAALERAEGPSKSDTDWLLSLPYNCDPPSLVEPWRKDFETRAVQAQKEE